MISLEITVILALQKAMVVLLQWQLSILSSFCKYLGRAITLWGKLFKASVFAAYYI